MNRSSFFEIMLTHYGATNFVIYFRSAAGKKKRGDKTNRAFLDEIKSVFHSFRRALS